MTSPETAIWLQERTALGILSPGVLNALAEVIEEKVVPANYRLVSEGTPPDALYILIEGQLESHTTNQTKPALAIGFLPGAVIHLQETLVG